MAVISDDEMRERLAHSRDYTVALLRVAPAADLPESRALIWEHGRRNFVPRAEGILPMKGFPGDCLPTEAVTQAIPAEDESHRREGHGHGVRYYLRHP